MARHATRPKHTSGAGEKAATVTLAFTSTRSLRLPVEMMMLAMPSRTKDAIKEPNVPHSRALPLYRMAFCSLTLGRA